MAVKLQPNFKQQDLNDSFTMKQNRKRELIAKKYTDIHNDFVKLLKGGKAPEAIYEKLSNKYYLDNETIYRVVLRKSGKSRKRNVDG